MTDPDHFSDSTLSCWQAAAADADVAAKSSTATPPPGALRDRNAPMLKAATAAAKAYQNGTAAIPSDSILTDIADCGKVALEIALAEVTGNALRAKELRSAFDEYGKCNAGWLECIDAFKAYYKSATTKKQYKPWSALSDFTFDDVPDKCRIAVIGDWGTGQDRAAALLRDLAAHSPDIVLHLGDIYYACTQPEADMFAARFAATFTTKMPRVFSLCGNHDMYSGGVAYQALITQLRQPASFFCLRNTSWQILGCDTGFNDFDPSTGGTIASWIQDHDGGDGYSELDWHKDKFATAGARRTIVCTHHQPFTRNSPVEGKATNERLLAQFAPHIDKTTLWLWGHEHNQVIYAPFRTVEKGRCVGASGVPTAGSEKLYTLAPELKGQQVPDILKPPSSHLKVDTRCGLYNLGYALIDLDGPNGSETYLQFDSSTNKATILFQESL